jgi:hypothetical protein
MSREPPSSEATWRAVHREFAHGHRGSPEAIRCSQGALQDAGRMSLEASYAEVFTGRVRAHHDSAVVQLVRPHPADGGGSPWR